MYKKDKSMKPLISVVIPVYNVEEYLQQCLDSVKSQTYENLEIILVDDGATDRSGSICEEFAKTEKRAVVIHQENQGLSGARNTGVSAATGEYIAFLDSDDWVSNEYIEYLYRLIADNNVQISSSRCFDYWDGSGVISNPEQGTILNVKLTTEEAIEELCHGIVLGSSAPDKMFKSELIKKYPFPLGKLYEDLAIMYKVIGESNGVAYTTKKLSYYRRREGSIINESFSERHLFALQAAKEQLKYIKQNFPRQIKAGEAKCCCVITQIMPMILESRRKDIYKQMKAEIKRYANSLLTDKKYAKKYKIRTLAVLCGYSISMAEYKTESFLKRLKGMKNS